MIKKKMIILGLVTASIAITGGIFYAKNYVYKDSSDVKVVAYKDPETSSEISENGYKINKFEDLNAREWVNGNEVLTLIEREDLSGDYCSISNLNSKETRDFKDVSIAGNGYFGVSKSGKYLLYGEERYVPMDAEGEEWQSLYESGDLQHQNIKILNFETKEITELKTQKINSDADYRWISDDKILIIYNNSGNGWEILNLKGEICASGTFDFSNCSSNGAWITGVEDLKDLGNSVEGEFYYVKDYKRTNGSIGEKVYSIDVNTKVEKIINGLETDIYADKKGDLILTEFCNESTEGLVDGIDIHRTYGVNIFNTEGQSVQKLELPEKMNFAYYKLSDDGKKLGYVQSINDPSLDGNTIDEIIDQTTLSVMNISTGKIQEIAKLSDFKENGSEEYHSISFSDISWSKNNKSLMFTCNYNVKEKVKFGDAPNEEWITMLKVAKSNTYMVTFDN